MPAFDDAPERPEHIDQILNGLDRYNPQTTPVFQDYVNQQCENQTYDCYANIALLKLYVLQGKTALNDVVRCLISIDDHILPQRFLLSEQPLCCMKLFLALSEVFRRFPHKILAM